MRSFVLGGRENEGRRLEDKSRPIESMSEADSEVRGGSEHVLVPGEEGCSGRQEELVATFGRRIEENFNGNRNLRGSACTRNSRDGDRVGMCVIPKSSNLQARLRPDIGFSCDSKREGSGDKAPTLVPPHLPTRFSSQPLAHAPPTHPSARLPHPVRIRNNANRPQPATLHTGGGIIALWAVWRRSMDAEG